MTYKLVYLARRARTVTREDWPRTWKSHAVFASQFPNLEANLAWMRYCNRIDNPGILGISAEHDGVALAASDTLKGIQGGVFSEDERALIDQDELRVFDMLTPNFTYFCTEDRLIDGPLGEVAVFSFLHRKSGMERDEFYRRWNGSHAAVARDAIESLGTSTRYAHNTPVHDPRPLFPFDGIAETWFPGEDEARAAFAGRELDPYRRDLSEFCDHARGVTMLTKVCHRWPKG